VPSDIHLNRTHKNSPDCWCEPRLVTHKGQRFWIHGVNPNLQSDDFDNIIEMMREDDEDTGSESDDV